MAGWSYYSEHDAEKAAWIRELIKAKVVADGEVDERDIKLVQPKDVRGFTQCHWFAGIAVWSYALRLAGWEDSRPCWTGSCPCPSFSCAGKGTGFDDPRHLWPHWYPLIRECRPGTLFGEQSDDAIGYGWLDLVSGDLEAAGYAVAPAVLGAHSLGAPHIRQRLYFCAHAEAAEVRSRPSEVYPRTGKESSNRSGNGSKSGNGSHSDGRIASNRNLQCGGQQRLLAEDCGTGERFHSTANRSEIRPQLHGEHDGMQSADGCEPCIGADSQHDGCDRPQEPSSIAHRDQPQERLFGRSTGDGSDTLGIQVAAAFIEAAREVIGQ